MGPAGAVPAGARALVPDAPLSYQTMRAGYRGVTYFSVRNVVAVFGALFVLALAFLILADGRAAGAVLDVFRSQSLLSKLAWVIIVLVPLIVVPSAVWLGETLVRQRQAAHALELRLDGVRQGVKSLVRSQADADAAVHQLIRSDPEEAIGAMKQRIGEAERVAHVQKGRNEIGDLGSRVEEIRTQQQALQKRLGPVLEKRRAIDHHVDFLGACFQRFARFTQLDVERRKAARKRRRDRSDFDARAFERLTRDRDERGIDADRGDARDPGRGRNAARAEASHFARRVLAFEGRQVHARDDQIQRKPLRAGFY